MKNNYLSFWLKTAVVLLICLLLVGSINYRVDPAHLFTEASYEKSIADYLNRGFNIANVSNYDERLLQKYYIKGIREKKDVVILGSSRSMGIGSGAFPHKKTFNNCVSRATLEDYVAIYELYMKKGLKPDIVVIGLDPWILNKSNKSIRWKTLSSDYFAASRRLGFKENWSFPNIIDYRYSELLSAEYLWSSLTLLFTETNKTGNYFPTRQAELDVPIKKVDGTLVYGKQFRNHSLSEVNAAAKKYASDEPVFCLGDYTVLDRGLETKTEQFVSALQADDIKVIFFLPPYHPIVYDSLSQSKRYCIIIDAENAFHNLARQKGIAVVGSYDPKKCNFTANDFYDGMHAKNNRVDQLFRDSSNIN